MTKPKTHAPAPPPAAAAPTPPAAPALPPAATAPTPPAAPALPPAAPPPVTEVEDVTEVQDFSGSALVDAYGNSPKVEKRDGPHGTVIEDYV